MDSVKAADRKFIRLGMLDGIRDGDEVGSGTRRILLDLVGGLDPSRFQCVVFLQAAGFFSRQIADLGAEVVIAGVPPLASMYRRAGPVVLPRPFGFATNATRLPRAILETARLLREHRIDIAYLPTYLEHVLGGMAARLAGIPSVAHIQGIPQAGHRVKLMLAPYKAWCSICGCVPVAISKAVATAWGRDRRGPPRVIYNSVDSDRFRPGRPDPAAFEALGLPLDGRPIVGILSRIAPGKRVHMVVPFARALATMTPSARILVCGDLSRDGSAAADHPDPRATEVPSAARWRSESPYFREIAEALEASGLDRNVTFAGHRDDLPTLLHGMDVVAHLCDIEGFGLVLVEAMSAGVPVVAFGTAGPAELIDDGVTGLTVADPSDVDGLARGVAALLGDPKRARRMSRQARLEVQRRFSKERFIGQFEELFASLAAGEP